MDSLEKLYQAGFNSGYLIAKFDPELIRAILQYRNPENVYFEALRLGRKEFEKEKILDRLKQQQNTNDKDLDRDD